jgi:hypothetical protein
VQTVSRRFPRSPEINEANPFENEHGQNPFSDSEPRSPVPVQENPYGGPAPKNARSYQPKDYATIYPSRSWLVLLCGISGVVLVTIGVSISVIALLTAAEWTRGLSYGVPFNLMGIVASVPAWKLGRNDRRAMQAGAMDASGCRGTTIGYVLGVLGTLGGAAPVAAFFVALIVEVLGY